MKCLSELPQGYRRILSLDLQNDKKLALRINIAALAVAAVMGIIAGVVTTREYFLYFDIVKIIIIFAGMFIYLVLHELVHGMAMKFFGSKTVKYGFSLLYAYAGSKDYFNKNMYIVTSLAPMVIWGVVLMILNLIGGIEWFWVIYLIQIYNIAGSTGDMYVVHKVSKMPKDVLVFDSGVSMEFYSAE